VKERFPNKAWVDVFSKEDAIQDILMNSAQLRQPNKSHDVVRRPEQVVALLPDALAVSSLTEVGIVDLKQKLMRILAEERQKDKSGWESERLEQSQSHPASEQIVQLGIKFD
jgi:hypothetical protein